MKRDIHRVVMIESPAIVNGALTEHRDRQRLLECVTEKALDCAINIAAEGVRLGDICAEIEDEAARNRFSVVREFVGHGVGRKLHEEPQIPNYGKRGSGPKLKAGMTLAIEPMVNAGSHEVYMKPDGWTICTVDGGLSAYFEHTVAITDKGPLILTALPTLSASSRRS